MPDTTQAAFSEVLQLQIDTDSFASQMDQVAAIYEAAVAKMSNLDSFDGDGISESLASLQEALQNFASNGAQALSGFSDSVASTSTAVQSEMEQAAEAIQAAQSTIVSALGEIREAQAGSAESVQGAGSSLSGFLGGLTESAVGMLKVVALYRLVSEGLNLAVEALTSPFKAVAEGMHYLSDVQERASIVKQALLDSVSYSADWGKNVEIAGQQADRLVQKIDDIAVKLHLSSKTVQAGFTSFLEAGGRTLTSNVDEALQASALITGQMQVKNPQIQGRQLRSTMENIVDGKPTQQDADSLNMSKQQLQEMVEHAAKYHDLLQEIQKDVPGIEDRIAGANDRQQDLVNTLELYAKRWEGLIAGPLFQQFTEILKQILQYVDDNHDKLSQVGRDLGNVIGSLAKAAESFIKANWGELVVVFKSIAVVALEIAKTINGIVSGLTEVVGLGVAAKDLVKGDASKAWGDVKNPVLNGFATNEALSQAQKDIWNVGNNPVQKDDAVPEDTALPKRHPTAPKTTGNPAAEYQKELRDEITRTTEAYQEQEEKIKGALADNTMNHEQAAAKVKQLTQDEIAEVDKLITKYQDKVKSSGAKGPQQSNALEAMQQQRDALQKQLAKESQEADNAAAKEKLENDKANYQAEYELAVQHFKQMQAVTKEKAFQGFYTPLQQFDSETGGMTIEHVQQRAQLQHEADSTEEGTTAHTTAINKLTALDDAYTANMILRSEQRIAQVEKEKQAQFSHSVDMDRAGITLHGSISSASNLTTSQRTQDATHQLQLQTELTEATIRNTAALLAEAQTKNANSDATRTLEQQLEAEQNTRIQQFGQAIQQSAARAGTNTGLGRVYASNTASQQITAGQSQLNQLNQQLQASEVKAMDDRNPDDQAGNQQQIQALKAEIAALTTSLQNMQKVADSLTPSFTQVGETLETSLFGPNFTTNITQLVTDFGNAHTATADLTTGFEGAADGLSALTNVGKTITGVLNQYAQGQKQGGTLGGIGSLLSSGPVSNALSAIPVVGSIVKPLGDAFSFIGDMFVQQAQKIAAQIEKNTQAISTAYSENQITLSQAITQLQAQEQSMITQLSGTKGGSQTLEQDLPALQEQIQSLENQAASTQKVFQDTITQLTAGGTELTSWVQTWQQINQQVANYLAAGGDMNTANAYLQANLQTQLQSVTDSLVQGDQQAIQDAINLNQLLQQRVDLVRQEQETEFGIENQNAIEKRESTGVQVASQLQNQRTSYDEQLDQLNYQITTTQEKVALESQVFSIASDTADLEAQSNELTLYSLNEQLLVYQQMQDIVKSTSGLTFSGGFTGGIPGTGITGTSGIAGVTAPITLTVNVNANGQDINSQQFSNYLATAIQQMVTANRTTP